MGVSGEGAALRSARTWLLLLCPEIPDRSGGKGAESVVVSRKAAGCLGGLQKRHGMAYGAAGKQHGVAGAYKRRNTQGRVEGAFSYPNWRLFCTGPCSAGSTRPDAGLRTPSIAAFDRSRPSAAVGRGPWIAAIDRRRRSRDRDRCCNCRSMSSGRDNHAHQRFSNLRTWFNTHGSNQDLAHFPLNMTQFDVFCQRTMLLNRKHDAISACSYETPKSARCHLIVHSQPLRTLVL